MREIPVVDNGVIKVSDEDYVYLSQFRWWTHGKSAQGIINHRRQSLSRVIAIRMGFDIESNDVYYIDGNPRNSQRDNLRLATKSQTQARQNRNKNNTSGYKGVSSWPDRRRYRWRARIMVNRKEIYLGSFESPEEAHVVYCRAAEKYFGEFANL